MNGGCNFSEAACIGWWVFTEEFCRGIAHRVEDCVGWRVGIFVGIELDDFDIFGLLAWGVSLHLFDIVAFV